MVTDIWLPSCKPNPGPTEHLDQYAAVPGNDPYGNLVRGIVNHSAEGYFQGSPSNAPQVMRNRGNSWTFTSFLDGRQPEQHYPLKRHNDGRITGPVIWATGANANSLYQAQEHEGVAGQPLTSQCLGSSILVQTDLCLLCGWSAIVKNQNGFEHNQFMSTDCPSGRIPWKPIEEVTRARVAAALNPPQEDDMDANQARQLGDIWNVLFNEIPDPRYADGRKIPRWGAFEVAFWVLCGKAGGTERWAYWQGLMENSRAMLFEDLTNDAATDKRRLVGIGNLVKQITAPTVPSLTAAQMATLLNDAGVQAALRKAVEAELKETRLTQ